MKTFIAGGLGIIAVIAAACGGESKDVAHENRCARIYLSESTQTIEGHVLEAPRREIPHKLAGHWTLRLADGGIATIRHDTKYVDAHAWIPCSLVDGPAG